MKPTNYSAPSKSRLVAALAITPEQADTIRGLIQGKIATRNPDMFPASNRWFKSCYNEPRRLDRILACINEVMQGHGVEAIWGADQFRPAADYINMGDTYSATILFNRETGSFSLTTWGDFYERNQSRYSLR